MPKYINSAEVLATFDGDQMTDRSSVEVEIPGIKLEKTADMPIWVGETLTFTIRISSLDSDNDATGIVLTDTINTSFANLVTTSVTVDDVEIEEDAGFTYDSGTGELRITAIDDIVAGSGDERTIIFQVTKA